MGGNRDKTREYDAHPATSSYVRPIDERPSILVIDDEPRFLESVRLALDDVYDVSVALDAQEGLRQLRATPLVYQAVLCDLAMPQFDGVDLYEEMVRLGLAHRFIVMTGGAFTDRAKKFVARKVCRVIGKPFLLESLLALLEEVTDKRETG